MGSDPKAEVYAAIDDMLSYTAPARIVLPGDGYGREHMDQPRQVVTFPAEQPVDDAPIQKDFERKADSQSGIDINNADAKKLEALPRIGPVKSDRIVTERKTTGLFETVEDLQRVKGIGPKIVEVLRPEVHIGNHK